MSWLSNLFSPPVANIPLPQMQNYQPTNMGSADQSAFGGIGNLSQFNMYPGMMGQAQDITQGMVNNPGAPSWLQGAQYAQNMGQGAAGNAFGAGGGLMSLGGNIANTAFDPQNDLYNRTLHNLTEQTRASQAARGIQTTPYGAGLENDAMRNFGIDWQNAQLMRQIQGGQAAGGLIGQGVGMQMQAPVQYAQFSALPYQTGQQIGQEQMGALQGYGQFGQAGAQLPQQQIADYMNYLGWGSGAQNAMNSAQLGGFNAQLNRDKQAAEQQASAFGGLGKMLGGLWGTPMGAGVGAPTLGATALSKLGTVGGSLLGMLPFSDRRVKEDVAEIGHLHDGQPVYSYRYIGDPMPRIGLMAQDVEKVRPDAVFEIGGIKAVDYGKATELARGLSALSNWG